VVAAGIFITYLALLYGIYVPDWEFLPPSLSSNSTLIQASSALTVSVVGKYLLIKTCTCQGSSAGSHLGPHLLSLNLPFPEYKIARHCHSEAEVG